MVITILGFRGMRYLSFTSKKEGLRAFFFFVCVCVGQYSGCFALSINVIFAVYRLVFSVWNFRIS